VGSTTANLGPKSLKTELYGRLSTRKGGLSSYLPKQTARLRGNEVDTVSMRPLIDLELLAEGNAGQDDDLQGLLQSRFIRRVRERRAWKPLIKSGEISCPGALGRTRTGT